jgi:hypothetical protein
MQTRHAFASRLWRERTIAPLSSGVCNPFGLGRGDSRLSL